MIHALTPPDGFMDIAQLAAASFEPLVNQAFSLELDGAGPMTLVAVESKPGPGTSNRTPFSVLFSSDDAGILPQQVYRLHHDALGTLEIFLVPVQHQGGKTLYEAIFN